MLFIKKLRHALFKTPFFYNSIIFRLCLYKFAFFYDLKKTYLKSKAWVYNNTFKNKGIIVSKDYIGAHKKPYPEVSGYYIPSLLNWGERDLAIQYAKWLCEIQNKDGSWNDYENNDPYVFDTGQILKGLIAAYQIVPEVKEHIIKGCDWILTNVQDSGRLTTPSTKCWSEPTCSELIHLYCLTPILEAGKLFNKPEYSRKVKRVISYYKKHYYKKLIDFHTLSHFYAYIVEALVDLGELEIANTAADNIIKLQKRNGAIPAYKNVNWVCSTGIFQFAVIFYKLGRKKEADKAFDYGCKLQLKSGGWLGSYGLGSNYSIYEEISWCNKYFLDALSLKLQNHFANTVNIKESYKTRKQGAYEIPADIDIKDGRVQAMLEVVNSAKPKKLLDIGCGKGRILKHVHQNTPQIDLYGLDVDHKIVETLPNFITGKVGTILNTGCDDETFDFVSAIEVLEHAIDIENAVKEMSRITKKNGTVLIVDKNKDHLGKFKMPPWEQWFDKKELKAIMEKNNLSVHIKNNISYENNNGSDELFLAWIGKKK